MKGEEGEKGDKKQGTNKAYRESERGGEREERRVEEVKGRRKYRSETGQKGTSIQQHVSERTRFETAKCVGVRRARENLDKYSVL